MVFADGKHLIDLAEIVYGYRDFGYDLYSNCPEPGVAYVAVGAAPFRGEPGAALHWAQCHNMPAAWRQLEGDLTVMAIDRMQMFYGFSERETTMAFSGARGELALRFRQIVGWKQAVTHYPDQ